MGTSFQLGTFLNFSQLGTFLNYTENRVGASTRSSRGFERMCICHLNRYATSPMILPVFLISDLPLRIIFLPDLEDIMSEFIIMLTDAPTSPPITIPFTKPLCILSFSFRINSAMYSACNMFLSQQLIFYAATAFLHFLHRFFFNNRNLFSQFHPAKQRQKPSSPYNILQHAVRYLEGLNFE